MPSRSMATNLPADGDGKRWEDASQETPDTSSPDERAARFFDAAVVAWISNGGGSRTAKRLALELGLREGHLTEHRSGSRSTALRHLLAFEGDTAAVLALLHSIAEELAPGRFEIRLVPRLNRKRAEGAILRRLAQLQGIRRAVFLEAAEDEGVEVAELERALESEEP